jgi:hypothetical protein
MSLNRHQQAPGAWRSAEFRTGNPFHGSDQRREPRHFAVFGAPLLRLLDHRLYFALTSPPNPLPVPTRPPKTRSPSMPEKNSGECDLLHKLSE